MKKIRIKNDIRISWGITVNGSKISLSSCKNLIVQLVVFNDVISVKEYALTENVITFSFLGENQTKCGLYTLICQYSDESGALHTIDKTDAFVLVPHTNEEGGSDNPKVALEVVQLSTDIDSTTIGKAATINVIGTNTLEPEESAYVRNTGTENDAELTFGIPRGKNGLTAYEVAVKQGYSGTKDEWLKSLKASLNYVLDNLDKSSLGKGELPSDGGFLYYNGKNWVWQGIGIDEESLAKYLEKNSYATKVWVLSQGFSSGGDSSGGINESTLRAYLIRNGYAKKTDIPDSWWGQTKDEDNIVKGALSNILSLLFEGDTAVLDGVAKDGTTTDSKTKIVTPYFGNTHYLSKTTADTASGHITFKQGLTADGTVKANQGATFGEYVKSLYAGKGAGIDASGNAEVESLRVRSYMQVMELIVNRLSALEGDQLLTESDTIESVDDLGDSCYGLHLRSKWDGYFTAQTENNVLKGIVNTLAKGSGEYYTAWMRVNSVSTANNYIEVTMYADADVPSGKNYPPIASMNIARWGNQTDTTRQDCLYFSSTEGRIVKLKGVTKPILDKENYGVTIGTLPDFVNSLTDGDGNPLPIRDGLDYLYVPGIITMDTIRLNKWTGKPVVSYVDRGLWTSGEKYYCEAKNPDTEEYETSDVWYQGCKYRCCKNLTETAPAWNNTDWAMIEGNPAFTVDFEEVESLVDPDSINLTLTIAAMLYNIDVTQDIVDSDVSWTRYSEDADGNERVDSDNVWAAKHQNTGKSLTLTRDDMNMEAYTPKTIRFTATVVLRDGMGNEASTASVSYEY